MNIQWDTLKACYLAVAACVSVARPPTPPYVEVLADVPHVTDGVAKHGFPCGTYCLDPPPPSACPSYPCDIPPGYCTQQATAYCAGSYDNPPSRGAVTVSEQTLAAIPHEFIHHLVQKRKLFREGGKEDPGDSAHVGPWWVCERKEAVPECAGLWRAAALTPRSRPKRRPKKPGPPVLLPADTGIHCCFEAGNIGRCARP